MVKKRQGNWITNEMPKLWNIIRKDVELSDT